MRGYTILDVVITFAQFSREYRRSAGQDLFDTVCDGCGTSCQNCTTSLETPQCSQVMEHVSSPGGSATPEALLIDHGYWQATNRSREILACYNAEACRGGATDRLDYCSTGYEGPCERQERLKEQTRYEPTIYIYIYSVARLLRSPNLPGKVRLGHEWPSLLVLFLMHGVLRQTVPSVGRAFSAAHAILARHAPRTALGRLAPCSLSR